MKVLQITHHTTPCVGGIENFVFDLCLQLKKQKIDSSILCLDRCPHSKKKLPKKESVRGIKIQRIPFFDLKYYKVAPKVLAFIKDFDVLHIHNIGFFSDFLALTKIIHKKKLVLNTHGGFFHTLEMSFFKKVYFHTLNRFSLHFFDLIIADSKNDEKIFFSVAEKKLVLIGNGVELEPFLKMNKKKEKHDFLYVGRLSKNKGLENLINTFYFVTKKYPNAKLRIMGADFDNIESKLKKLVLSLGIQKKVVILGEVSRKKLLEEMSKARFAVSASEYEGFGIAVIEQMAAKQVPVLSNIPNFKWFTENGKNGFIIDFSNEQIASKKIIEILGRQEKEIERFGEKARQSAESFSWQNSIKKVIEVYQKVALE